MTRDNAVWLAKIFFFPKLLAKKHKNFKNRTYNNAGFTPNMNKTRMKILICKRPFVVVGSFDDFRLAAPDELTLHPLRYTNRSPQLT